MMTPRYQENSAPSFAAKARRHSGWLFGFLFAGLALSVVAAYLIPDTFRSTATLKYQSTSTGLAFESELNERMNAAINRSELVHLIERQDIYTNDRKRLPVADVAQNMTGQIHFGRILRSNDDNIQSAIFPVWFDYSDRFKAQKVVADLSAQMILANLRATYGKSGQGSTALPSKDALEGSRKDLEEAENLISEFREKNADRLPEKSTANQEMMSSLRTALAKVQSQIAQSTRDQAALQGALAAELEKRRNLKLTVETPEPEKVEDPRLSALDAEIKVVEDRIKDLKTQYTENFPDVKNARQKLEKLRIDRTALTKTETAAVPPRIDVEAARTASSVDAEIKRVQAQMEAKAAEADRLSKEATEMDRAYQAAQLKFDGSSDLEKQYAELVKDRDIAKGRYDEEEIRYQAALQTAPPSARGPIAASSLEVIDPANLPATPYTPNRPMVIGSGLLAGLIAGLIAVTIRTVTDSSDYDPAAESRPGGVLLRWAIGLVVGAGAMIVSVLYYYSTKV